MVYIVFFFKQKTAYEILTCDWSSDVCSSDLVVPRFSCLGTEVSKGSVFRNGWFQRFSVQELKALKFPFLEMCSCNISWLGTEASNGSLFRNGWFQRFSVQNLRVRIVPYLEMGCFNVFLSRKLWFQCFLVQELKVPMVPSLEMCSSNVFLFRN